MTASEWDDLASWWIEEGSRDPLYDLDVLPWLSDLVATARGRVLDLGCGEGQAMRHLDHHVVGCDLNPELLRQAVATGPVVRSRLPHLGWLRDDSVAGAYAVFVLEHLADPVPLFVEAARVVEDGGILVLIANHPAYTAPGAGPLLDVGDGEVLWRWGPYFSRAVSEEPAGPAAVTFHHRPLGLLLNEAAAAGWSLEHFEERGLSEAIVTSNPSLTGQEHLPRMIGVRWSKRRRSSSAASSP